MPRRYNPAAVAPPFSTYSQAVEVPPGARQLQVSGQVGVTPDGQTVEGAEAQIEQSWRNLLAILAEAGMGAEDIVKVTGFITRPDLTGLYREVRERMLGGAEPASTLLVVAGLASPDWVVEIEVVAAKLDG